MLSVSILSLSELLESIPTWGWVSLASCGAVVVVMGLLMEYISTDKKRCEEAGIKDFGSRKALAKKGEVWVIAGICLEIAIGITINAKDRIKIGQANANAPAKMRVGSISAMADFSVETNFDDPGTSFRPMYGYPALLILSSDPLTNAPGSTPPPNHLGIGLICDDFHLNLTESNDRTKENRALVNLKFDSLPYEFDLSQTNFNGAAGEMLQKLKYFSIRPDFLNGNTVGVWNGRLTLLVNGISRELKIPDQKIDLNPMNLNRTNIIAEIPFQNHWRDWNSSSPEVIPVKLGIDNF